MRRLFDCSLVKWQLKMKKWLLMKETWLKGSKQVCGMTKGPPRHKETWWWKMWLPNESYVTKPDGNLNRLKINIR